MLTDKIVGTYIKFPRSLALHRERLASPYRKLVPMA